ncbi:sensor domain-containing diguanylate cyclase [Erythrobacter mangrovi]|uniref:diguanylate cyclase n=1 Tax=Erythrobacter mangrovi TaxID=2739433 RepID=A0A7D4BN09_9SPHN|nr:diguanylate cyclase [Erythrobacter mangrovi]QKG70724.1 diguanylate cyclase [Erythrobacter mangrovi]
MGWLTVTVAHRALAKAVLALLAGMVLFAQPAKATEEFAPGSICHTAGPASLDHVVVEREAARWICEDDNYDWKKPRELVRIDLRDRSAGELNPRFAELDRHEFEHLAVIVKGVDGSSATRNYTFRETSLGLSSLRSIIPLPELQEQASSVVFVIDGSKWPESFANAELVENASMPPLAGYAHLLAALICGLLLAPMLFDFGYFRALREPFPLFHALFCLMAFVQTAAVSGLIPLLTPIDFDTELLITYFSVDIMIAATMLFASNFIEPEYLTRRCRLILLGIAAGALINGSLTTFKPHLFGTWIDHFYFGNYMILLAAYFHVLGSGWRQGSRMAPYLVLGFAPFAGIMLIQFTTIFIATDAYGFDETWPQNLALLFEVVATALAVADRFISIKRERDQAVSEARSLEVLSERDELTGLFNRRALTSRYADLVTEGFHAMALLDIDHFKEINDLHGHPVGDEVLKCMADALTAGDDEDAQVFRIGGEEFLLLLRGNDARQRAEARRRALTARTFAMMEGLERPVTASMGFLDFAAVSAEPSVDFGTLYTRADQLLYAAKCAGRNRTVEDRLELFIPAEDTDEAIAAA